MLKAVFHKFYLVHTWILCSNCDPPMWDLCSSHMFPGGCEGASKLVLLNRSYQTITFLTHSLLNSVVNFEPASVYWANSECYFFSQKLRLIFWSKWRTDELVHVVFLLFPLNSVSTYFCKPEVYFQPNTTSMIKLFCENSKQLKAVNYFRKKAPS